MRAMILAAGRGERMRELTRMTPKPLLKIKEHFLIESAIHALKKAGISEIVINVCYQADQIKAALQNGARYGVSIVYSDEEVALETGGGIFQALPLLGDEPFVVMSCDIVCDYDLTQLPKEPEGLAHLVLVNNPDFHPQGDFSLMGNQVTKQIVNPYTFANMGVYRKELFAECVPGRFRLNHLFDMAMRNQQLTGEVFAGVWHNIGTPEQLADFVGCD